MPGQLLEASDDALEFIAAVDTVYRSATADRDVLEHASVVRDEPAPSTGGRQDDILGIGLSGADAEQPEPDWLRSERVARARDASTADFVGEYLAGRGCQHALPGVGLVSYQSNPDAPASHSHGLDWTAVEDMPPGSGIATYYRKKAKKNSGGRGSKQHGSSAPGPDDGQQTARKPFASRFAAAAASAAQSAALRAEPDAVLSPAAVLSPSGD